MSSFTVSTPILTFIKYFGYLIAIGYSIIWLILIIFSSTAYEFSNSTTNFTCIECYQNFTTSMQSQTMRYSFDFWMIWLEVIIAALLIIIWFLLMAEIRQVAFYFIHAGLSILIIFFYGFKVIYYYIAFLSCQLYWFCVSPCTTPYYEPTIAFWISFIFGFISLSIAVIQVLINPVIHGLSRAARKKEILIKGESGPIESKIDDDGDQYNLLSGFHLIERGFYNLVNAENQNGEQLEMESDDDHDERYH